VKPIVIFFGPHHEGRAAAELDETATTLVETMMAATATAPASTDARDLKRIKLVPFLDVRQWMPHI